jgi:hypothetical protein
MARNETAWRFRPRGWAYLGARHGTEWGSVCCQHAVIPVGLLAVKLRGSKASQHLLYAIDGTLLLVDARNDQSLVCHGHEQLTSAVRRARGSRDMNHSETRISRHIVLSSF